MGHTARVQEPQRILRLALLCVATTRTGDGWLFESKPAPNVFEKLHFIKELDVESRKPNILESNAEATCQEAISNHSFVPWGDPCPSTPSQSNDGPKTFTTIRSERHSGSNWLRTLLKENFENQSPRPLPDRIKPTGEDWGQTHGSSTSNFIPGTEGLYGWKHAALLPDDVARLRRHKGHSLIVLLQCALPWHESMVKTPYGNAWRMVSDRCRLHHSPWFQKCDGFMKNYYGCHPGKLIEKDSFDEFSDSMTMRTEKYRSWLSLEQCLPGQIAYVSYEALITDTPKELRRLQAELNLVWKPGKEAALLKGQALHNHYEGHSHKISIGSHISAYLRRDYMRRWATEDVAWVLSRQEFAIESRACPSDIPVLWDANMCEPRSPLYGAVAAARSVSC